MLTVGVVIETLPDCAGEVAHQLAVTPELRIHQTNGSHLIGVCSVPAGETLTAFLERIAVEHPRILSIRPTFVSE